jgi:hypothetical protein
LAALAANRLRADGGEFVAPVWLVEGTVCNSEAAQSVLTLEKLALAWNGANDQVRMRQVGGKKRFCNLDGCVAGLDDLLRNGQVIPHEEARWRDYPDANGGRGVQQTLMPVGLPFLIRAAMFRIKHSCFISFLSFAVVASAIGGSRAVRSA